MPRVYEVPSTAYEITEIIDVFLEPGQGINLTDRFRHLTVSHAGDDAYTNAGHLRMSMVAISNPEVEVIFRCSRRDTSAVLSGPWMAAGHAVDWRVPIGAPFYLRAVAPLGKGNQRATIHLACKFFRYL